MMKRLIVIVFLLGSVAAFACKCKKMSGKNDVSVVFLGKVTGIKAKGNELEITFEVKKVLKGKLSSKNRATILTRKHPASCGYTFGDGATYAVYANEIEGKLKVSRCSMTEAILADEISDYRAKKTAKN